MIVEFLIGAAVGGILTTVVLAFLDDIIDWAKEQFRKLASWIKRSVVKIKRLPGAVKQFMYYVENGTVKVKTEERDATQEEIDDLRNGMTADKWNEFINGKNTEIANLEREEDD